VKCSNFGGTIFALVGISQKVHRLRARYPIPEMTIMGEYTGELKPKNPDKPDEKTQYHFEIDFSDEVEGGDPTMRCWLDANRTGSVFRFVNHNCDPNAVVRPGRCGMHNRIIFVSTKRSIAEGEEMTINYGSQWFSTPEEPCLCESSKCRNSPKDDTLEETGKERAHLSKAT
jgi:SET domain-containing protein